MMTALDITVPTAKLQDHKDYTLYSARAAYKCFLKENIHCTYPAYYIFKTKPRAVLSVTRLAQSDGCPTQFMITERKINFQ